MPACRRLLRRPAWPELYETYRTWRDKPGNFAKPLHRMLEEDQAANDWFAAWLVRDGSASEWRDMKSLAQDLAEYRQSGQEWSSEKIAAYNERLSGKILIPQPLGGQLRNLYEPESGFCISKFLVLQLLVALVMVLVFTWMGRKLAGGGPPKGRLCNLLELILVYLRDNVARPVMGAHDGDRFVPLLWTIFAFVLGCNLCGLIPWLGTPTASFGVTAGLAAVTFFTGMVIGMQRFGVTGFFWNQVPAMSLPLVMAIFIKPLILVLELVGMCIKHAVLALRLMANMLAGHMVLLGILGVAFGASGALMFECAIDLDLGRNRDGIGGRVGVVQLLGVVCCLLAGLHFYVSVRIVYRGGNPSPLIVGANRIESKKEILDEGEMARESISEVRACGSCWLGVALRNARSGCGARRSG
jgi:F-type H+-transporting ATPase subunit a